MIEVGDKYIATLLNAFSCNRQTNTLVLAGLGIDDGEAYKQDEKF